MNMDENELPDIQDENLETIVTTGRRKLVKFSDQEIIMLVRAYQVHPCSWVKIQDAIFDNLHQLPGDTQEFYKKSTPKQLKDRLSTKLSKLLACPDSAIKNATIRDEFKKIRSMEMKLATPSKDPKGTEAEKKKDHRNIALQNLSSSEEEQRAHHPNECIPSSSNGTSHASESSKSHVASSTAQKRKRKEASKGSRKKPLLSLVRENQEAYNAFITKKVPKLLEALGISDSEESD